MNWKKGRGKLGIFKPLLGQWRAEAESDMGPVICTRKFSRVLESAYVQFTVDWEYSNGSYQEIAFIGVRPDGKVGFWSFTSSNGVLVDVTDIHPEAIGFEAKMPAGLARMAYWPDDVEGFHWIVESKTKKGWNRFTEHHYVNLSE